MTKTPLDQLSEALAPDMKQVNSCIMEQMQSPVALIPQLAGYLIASGGKRLRPLLTIAMTSIFGGNMSRAHGLAACVEFIHTATLLHDDVVDESEQRRGKDAANLVFGNQASVLVGDFLFSRAFQLMTADGSLDVLKILSDASATIAEGEVLQLSETGNLNAGFDTYLNIINAKTAALFAAACEVGPVIAGAPPEQQLAAREFGANLGIAFQIIDDVLDYSAAREKLGKTIGDDFREGKVTAPVLYALDADKDFWARTMQDHTQNDGDLQTALKLIKETDALEKSVELATSYTDKARENLDALPDSEIKNILYDVLNFVIDREF